MKAVKLRKPSFIGNRSLLFGGAKDDIHSSSRKSGASLRHDFFRDALRF
jgi:hypothetical protein